MPDYLRTSSLWWDICSFEDAQRTHLQLCSKRFSSNVGLKGIYLENCWVLTSPEIRDQFIEKNILMKLNIRGRQTKVAIRESFQGISKITKNCWKTMAGAQSRATRKIPEAVKGFWLTWQNQIIHSLLIHYNFFITSRTISRYTASITQPHVL